MKHHECDEMPEDFYLEQRDGGVYFDCFVGGYWKGWKMNNCPWCGEELTLPCEEASIPIITVALHDSLRRKLIEQRVLSGTVFVWKGPPMAVSGFTVEFDRELPDC